MFKDFWKSLNVFKKETQPEGALDWDKMLATCVPKEGALSKSEMRDIDRELFKFGLNKKEVNPWAVCNSQGLSGDKLESCILHVKEQQGVPKSTLRTDSTGGTYEHTGLNLEDPFDTGEGLGTKKAVVHKDIHNDLKIAEEDLAYLNELSKIHKLGEGDKKIQSELKEKIARLKRLEQMNRTKSIMAKHLDGFLKDVGVGYAGPVPESKLADQDLEPKESSETPATELGVNVDDEPQKSVAKSDPKSKQFIEGYRSVAQLDFQNAHSKIEQYWAGGVRGGKEKKYGEEYDAKVNGADEKTPASFWWENDLNGLNSQVADLQRKIREIQESKIPELDSKKEEFFEYMSGMEAALRDGSYKKSFLKSCVLDKLDGFIAEEIDAENGYLNAADETTSSDVADALEDIATDEAEHQEMLADIKDEEEKEKSVGDDMNHANSLIVLHAERIKALMDGDDKKVKEIDAKIREAETKKPVKKAAPRSYEVEMEFTDNGETKTMQAHAVGKDRNDAEQDRKSVV